MQPFMKNVSVEYAEKAAPGGEIAQALAAQQEAINKKYTQVDAGSWDLDNLTEEQSDIIESMKVILAYNGHFFVPTYYNTNSDHIYCGYTCLEVYDASTIYSKVIKYERYTPTAGSGTAELNEFTHSLGGTKLYRHRALFTIDSETYGTDKLYYSWNDTHSTAASNIYSIDRWFIGYVEVGNGPFAEGTCIGMLLGPTKFMFIPIQTVTLGSVTYTAGTLYEINVPTYCTDTVTPL